MNMKAKPSIEAVLYETSGAVYRCKAGCYQEFTRKADYTCHTRQCEYFFNHVTGTCRVPLCSQGGHSLRSEGAHRRCDQCNALTYVVNDFLAPATVWCQECIHGA